MWDNATLRLLSAPLKHSAELTGLTFSPNGRVLLAWAGPITRNRVITGGRLAWMWETATGRPIGKTLTHTADISAALFSPAGDLVVIGNLNPHPRPFTIPPGEFQVWETRTGAKKARLVHSKGVLAMAFRSDGAYFATLDLDGVLRLWRTEKWQCIGESPPQQVDYYLDHSLVFGADGHSVIAVDGRGVRRTWQPPYPLDGTAASLRAKMESQTGLTLDDEGLSHLLKPADWEKRRRK